MLILKRKLKICVAFSGTNKEKLLIFCTSIGMKPWYLLPKFRCNRLSLRHFMETHHGDQLTYTKILTHSNITSLFADI